MNSKDRLSYPTQNFEIPPNMHQSQMNNYGVLVLPALFASKIKQILMARKKGAVLRGYIIGSPAQRRHPRLQVYSLRISYVCVI